MNLNSKLVTGICGAAAVAVIGTGGYLMVSSETSQSSGPSSGPSDSSGSFGSSAESASDTMSMTDGSFLDIALAAADESDLSGDQADQSDQSGSAAPEATARPGDRRPGLVRHPLRARRFLRGIHGTATVRIKDGGFAQVAWQRGQVTAVSGGTLTVRSADGTTWQWGTNSNTKVRRHGDKASVSQLAANDRIFVIGTVSGSTRTTRAAVVPKAR